MPAGFASLTPNGAPRPPGPAQAPKYGGAQPMGMVEKGARGARQAMDILGVPNWRDLIGGLGGKGGLTEFGNSGAAAEGANFAKGEYEKAGQKLGDVNKRGFGAAGPNPFAGDVRASRNEYEHPTGSSAFQSLMGLASEKTAAAVSEEQRAKAEAAQRSGYAGGYDPRSSDIDRMRALAETGFGAVSSIRGQALDRYKSDTANFGNAYQADLSARMGRYNTDMGAYSDLAKSALGSYTDLTKTRAELPTKALSAIAPLYSSLFGSSSDFFKSSLGATQDEEQQRRADVEKNRLKLYGIGPEFSGSAGRSITSG
jgi:hypothetical protein